MACDKYCHPERDEHSEECTKSAWDCRGSGWNSCNLDEPIADMTHDDRIALLMKWKALAEAAGMV